MGIYKNCGVTYPCWRGLKGFRLSGQAGFVKRCHEPAGLPGIDFDIRPGGKSLALYGDLFALKHQIEAEETAKPQEFVWGVGVATWQIPYGASTVSFEYPMLTQAVELSIDEKSMALELRPRATDTRVEMEAFVACSVHGAADVEHAVKEHLQRHKDRPISPFDSSSYRPGRIEPRAVKRRPKSYPLLTKPRHKVREEIKIQGHPKKSNNYAL